MPLKPSKFQIEERIHLAGQAFRVTGIAQLELPDSGVATRYLVSAGAGEVQILEERGGRFALLKQFSPTAAPEPSGREILVLGMRYVLGGVDRLAVLGSEGLPVGAAPQSGLLLSGRFEGESALILREFAPGGTAAQSFYTVKPLGEGEVMNDPEHAAMDSARLQRVRQQAAVDAETGAASGGWGMRIGIAAVVLIVVATLAYSCTAEKRLGAAQQLSARG